MAPKPPFNNRVWNYLSSPLCEFAEKVAPCLNISGSAISTSYSDLYNKMLNQELIPGQYYIVTDYRSSNFLNGAQTAQNNPTPVNPAIFNPRQIYYGEVEPLIVEAISAYELSPIAYSTVYQGDIIEYNAYTNKLGVDLEVYNSPFPVLPNGNSVSGFDLKWDGTNVYFNMPTGYPVLYGHYFYLSAEFTSPTYGSPTSYSNTGTSTGSGLTYTIYPKTYSGTGRGAVVSIVSNLDNTYTVYNSGGGSNYQVGDSLFVAGSLLGGLDGANDILIIVDTIDGYYAQDGVYEPITPVYAEAQYPFTDNIDNPKPMSRLAISPDGMKVTLLDLTYQDFLNYNLDTLYINSVYAIGDAYGYITRRKDTFKNIDVPCDFRGIKYRRYLINALSVNAYFSQQYVYGGTQDISNIAFSLVPCVNEVYQDFNIFGNYGTDCYDIYISGSGGPDGYYYYNGCIDNTVFLREARNIFMPNVRSLNYNSFNNSVYSFNYYGVNINSNLINSISTVNITAPFTYNVIADITLSNLWYINSNIIGSIFECNFTNGMFSNTVKSISSTTGASFSNNNFPNVDFLYNKFSDFASNTSTDAATFQKNEALNTSVISKNFTGASHVYGDYDCTILKASNTGLYLTYYNGTVQSYVNPTS